MPLSKQQIMIGVGVASVVTVILIIVVMKSNATKKCDLVCKNGGTAKSDCTSCACVNQWKGNQCEKCDLTCDRQGYTPDVTCVNCVFMCPDFDTELGKDVTKASETLSKQYPALSFVPTQVGAMIIRDFVQTRVRLYYDKDTKLITIKPRCG